MADGHITVTVDPVMVAMAQALAAIDAELGLPEDGCNSTAQTLAAIKKLKDGRDAFQESLYAELDTNFRLRDLGGTRADESMTPFLERVIAERDTLRAAVSRACAGYPDDETAPTCVAILRAALKPNVRANRTRRRYMPERSEQMPTADEGPVERVVRLLGGVRNL
jgi:hypothetical protein